MAMAMSGQLMLDSPDPTCQSFNVQSVAGGSRQWTPRLDRRHASRETHTSIFVGPRGCAHGHVAARTRDTRAARQPPRVRMQRYAIYTPRRNGTKAPAKDQLIARWPRSPATPARRRRTPPTGSTVRSTCTYFRIVSGRARAQARGGWPRLTVRGSWSRSGGLWPWWPGCMPG